MELKTIEREGKPARHYIDGKPCHSDAMDRAISIERGKKPGKNA